MMQKLMTAAIALAALPVSAQSAEPDVSMLAQMSDRCMATYAVQLTRTATPDEEIYTKAEASCRELNAKLTAAVRAQFPAAQAEDLIGKFEASAKPNFMTLLARIRADRAARTGSAPQ